MSVTSECDLGIQRDRGKADVPVPGTVGLFLDESGRPCDAWVVTSPVPDGSMYTTAAVRYGWAPDELTRTAELVDGDWIPQRTWGAYRISVAGLHAISSTGVWSAPADAAAVEVLNSAQPGEFFLLGDTTTGIVEFAVLARREGGWWGSSCWADVDVPAGCAPHAGEGTELAPDYAYLLSTGARSIWAVGEICVTPADESRASAGSER